MKKLIATMLAVGGLAAYASAQGTFTIDSFANTGDGATPASSSGGLVFLNGVLDTTTDINLVLLYGTTSGTATTPLNIDLGGSAGYWSLTQSDKAGIGDITSYANGCILDANGNTYSIPTIAAGSTAFLVLEAWTGNATSYAAAQTTVGAFYGQTAAFAITLAANSNPVQPDTHTMGSLNLIPVVVPEPSTMALAGLGGLATLLFRRKK